MVIVPKRLANGRWLPGQNNTPQSLKLKKRYGRVTIRADDQFAWLRKLPVQVFAVLAGSKKVVALRCDHKMKAKVDSPLTFHSTAAVPNGAACGATRFQRP